MDHLGNVSADGTVARRMSNASITFHLKEHHLKLARAMYVGWQDCETGAPEIDPKRPYGNSDVAPDVAEIIGKPWPDSDELSERAYERKVAEVEPRMMAIHHEMQVALQILLNNAGDAVVPGIWRNVAGLYAAPKWVRAAD
jgi:hypothetical protein